MFTQQNGIEIKEGNTYRSVVGDLVRITKIDLEKNSVRCYNVSESCSSWHRIDSAIKDNKFREFVK